MSTPDDSMSPHGRPLREREMSIVYSDLVDFTGMTHELGDRVSYGLVAEHHRMVTRHTLSFGGERLELRGDGVLLAFGDPESALDCSTAIHRSLELRRPGQKRPVLAHTALHCGSVVFDGELYFGRVIILASRLSDVARPSEILVSSDFRKRVEHRHDLRLSPERAINLRGFAEQVRVSSLDWRPRSGSR